MRIYDQKQVEQLRMRYPKGTRLCLDFMDEPGMSPGLQGTGRGQRMPLTEELRSVMLPFSFYCFICQNTGNFCSISRCYL